MEVLAAAVLLAARVSTLLAKVAVTPVGMPVAASATAPEKPFVFVVVIVLVPLAPCAIDTLFGDAAKLKFGAGAAAVTVRLTVAV